MCTVLIFFHCKDGRCINPSLFANLKSALKMINNISVFENGLVEAEKVPEAIKYFFFFWSLLIIRFHFSISVFNME